MNVVDQKQRDEALDITSSKVIIAPAGSGKTELLVKRYLKLLCVVNKPEQIQFITHTNKAAREMRDRVIKALQRASKGIRPALPHEVENYELSLAALGRDKELGWDLIANPNQLNIITNDALNNKLVAMAPFTSKMGANVSVCDAPDRLYKKAAFTVLEKINSTDANEREPVELLLGQVSNDFERAQTLIMSMLSSREQWLPIVMQVNTLDDTRQELESSFREVVSVLTMPTISSLAPYFHELIDVAEFSSRYASGELKEDLMLLVKESSNGIESLSGRSLSALGNIVMSSAREVTLRKQPHASMGFPAQKDGADKLEKAMIKGKRDAFKDLLAELAGDHNVTSTIGILKAIPDSKYSDEAWALLESLLKVMPIAVAHLKLVFNQSKEVDFTEISMAALEALGNEDSPSEILMKSDHQIKHILVDEFQDTNHTQVQLIKMLTSGWESQDGRTLTMVGDAMQSIYLFRGATVGLFANIVKNGIGELKLDVIQLSCNFRSQGSVIQTTNEVFAQLMPSELDLNSGAIPYSPSVAVKPEQGDSIESVFFDALPEEATKMEANYILGEIEEIQQREPQASIAILGRSRNDLNEIINLFKSKQVGHVAVDILKLENNEVVMDVMALTKALVDELDTLPWAELLRTPMVGFDLENVFKVTPKRKHDTVFQNIKNPQVVVTLPEQYKLLATRLVTVVDQARDSFYRKTLVDIVKGAFIELGGLNAVRNETDKDALVMYFEMLEQFGMSIPNAKEIDSAVKSLYSKESPTENPVKIMTVHKAKGLEFDYVFIPQCHKGTRGDTGELLAVDVLLNSDGTVTPVLAPMVKSEDVTQYDFIKEFNRVKKQNEIIRAAYVGLTRHKNKIVLTGESAKPIKSKDGLHFRNGSFFKMVNPNMDGKVYVGEDEQYIGESTAASRRYFANYNSRLLPESKILAEYRGVENINNDILPEIEVSGAYKSLTGEVIHKLMENYCSGVLACDVDNLASQKEMWRLMLVEFGVSPGEIIPAINHIEKCLTNTLRDPNAQWIINAEDNSRTELAINVMESGKLKTLVIDRVFDDNDKTYVIDWKSSELLEGESEQKFVSRMLETYEHQMSRYTKAAAGFTNNEVISGLYLMAIGRFVTYEEQQLLAA